MAIVLSADEERRYAELLQLAADHARNGETAELEAMLFHGLPLNLADAKGNTLLMLASYHGNEETAAMLLRRGADPDRRNDRGQTPLGGVAFKGYAGIARLLLDHGAEIDADNGGGMTPLMFAGLFGRNEVAALLKERGAGQGKRLAGSWLVGLARAVSALRNWFAPRVPRPSLP